MYLGDELAPEAGSGFFGPILSPNETSYRLDSLRDAWNKLRNDVLGRGTVPPAHIPPELADRVGRQYEAWRAWYQDLLGPSGVVKIVPLDFHIGSPFARALADWTETYGHLREDVVSAGVSTDAPPLAPVSPSVLPKLPQWFWPVTVGGVFSLAALWIILRAPRRVSRRAAA